MNHVKSTDLWSEIVSSQSTSVGQNQSELLNNVNNEPEIHAAKNNLTLPDNSEQKIPPNQPIPDSNESITTVAPNTSGFVYPETPRQEQQLINRSDQPALEMPSQGHHLNSAQPLDPMKFPNPPCPGSRQPPSTIENIRHLLREYKIIARYNIIKKKVEILLPSHIGTMDNMENVTMTYIVSLAALNGMNCRVPDYVYAVADGNAYNPVEEWINSNTWDGKDRLPDIYDTVTERDDYPSHLKKILLYKWLLSAVAAVLKPKGFRSRGVLTFQGEQGIGKTSWIMSLVPDMLLREMVVKIDHHLDGSNKDSILGAITHWIVEIGELDSSFKKDIARLKGFLTSDCDKVRRPYGRAESEYPRRTVFFASVNQSEFLVDNTGNTRWWTIPVIAINFHHRIDMQQLFAQLAIDYRNGKQWWLDQEEEDLLESCNKEHRSASVIRELILENIDLDLKSNDGHPAMTATQVLKEVVIEKPTNSQAKECEGILRELLGEHKRIKGQNKWRIPLKHSNALMGR